MRSLTKLLIVCGIAVLTGCSVLAEREIVRETENNAQKQSMSTPDADPKNERRNDD